MTECTVCEWPIGELRDEASTKEAKTSGICQGCQDAYFGKEPKVAKEAAIEEFPVVEEATEEIESEPRLPDWIENSWT